MRRKFVIMRRIASGVAVAAVLVLGIVLLPVRSSETPGAVEELTIVADRLDSGQGMQEGLAGAETPAEMSGSGISGLLAEAYVDKKEENAVKAETVPDKSAIPPEVSVKDVTVPGNEEAAQGGQKEKSRNAAADEESVSYGLTEDSYIIGEPVAGSRKKSRFSVTANGLFNPSDASGNVDFSSQNFSSGLGNASSGNGIVPISMPKHSFPVTVGVNVIYSFLGDRLGVGLGLNYTFMKSSYEALVNQSSQSIVQQRLHYLGVPLDFYVNFISSKGFRLYANAGGMMEKGLSAIYNVSEITNNQYTIEESIDGLQWSVNIGIGFEYRFVNFAGLYLDPRLTYYFDCDQPYSVRTEQPLQFGLQFGFRFHI